MKIKICGMREAQNVEQVSQLEPDLMGFIFYEKSPRSVTGTLDPYIVRQLSPTITRVGVFVNEGIERVLQLVKLYGLDAVQLHGDEPPAFCSALRAHHVKLIKALRIGQATDLAMADEYEGSVDQLLFDTRGRTYGGTGKKFDWDLLASYRGNLPFLLSGGIGPGDLPLVLRLHHERLAGVDLNSGFEIAPGNKNVETLKSFIETLRHEILS